MPLAYHAADVFAFGTVYEGFGRAVLEAMAAALPVVLHDFDLFQWMAPDPLARVDVTRDGAVAERLATLLGDPDASQAAGARSLANAAERFDWPVLLPSYREMYQRARDVPPLSR
jgi:glycosyltransferase involved in cell wall biosynthesis